MSEPCRIITVNGVYGCRVPDNHRYSYWEKHGWGWDDNDHALSDIGEPESCAFAAAWWRMQYHENRVEVRGITARNQADQWQRAFEAAMEKEK